MGEMAVLGKEGDTKLMWDADDAVSTENAKNSFENFLKKGYLAFEVEGKDGKKGKQVTKFDPKAERYIFSPPMVGG